MLPFFCGLGDCDDSEERGEQANWEIRGEGENLCGFEGIVDICGAEKF